MEKLDRWLDAARDAATLTAFRQKAGFAAQNGGRRQTSKTSARQHKGDVMVGIKNSRGCTPAELQDLKKHLVQLIESGAKVTKGEISPLAEIGRIRTIFKDIGSVLSKAEYGQDTFLVSQVQSVLKSKGCTDIAMRDKIAAFKTQIASGKFRLTVTLLETDGDLYIFDGDKSAVAFFEHSSETGSEDCSLPVFVIKPPCPLHAVKSL
jgi:hypothetical protein